MRTATKLRIAVYTVLAVLCGYVALGLYVRTGKILAVSRNEQIDGKPTIKVREVHEYPLSMYPIALLVEDNPPYRFEYYDDRGAPSQTDVTFQGKSFTTNSAQIKWAADGTATVYLGGGPSYTCKNGNWQRVE